MTLSRKIRPVAHRRENDAITRAYGQVLRDHLTHLDKASAPAAIVHTAVRNMHEVASATFPAAFLRGKRQSAGDLGALHAHDQHWIDQKLATNFHDLAEKLTPDLLVKIEDLRLDLPGESSGSLNKTFGSRVENLYGGHLWTVHEAGFRSGVHDLRDAVAMLTESPTLFQEDTNDTSDEGDIADGTVGNGKKKEKDHWAVIALLLGIPEKDLKEEYTTLQIGVEYHTQEDGRVCSPCAAAADIYFYPRVSPLPGEVCTGGPNCRCYLQIVVRKT